MQVWRFRPIRERDWPLVCNWFMDQPFRFRTVTPELFGEEEIARLARVPEVSLVERHGSPVGLAFLEVMDPAAGRAKVDLRLAAAPEWAAEAWRAWASLAFAHLGLRRLVATCAGFDEAATRSLMEAGFHSEGSLQDLVFHQGRYWEERHFALLRDEWEGGTAR